MRRNPYLLSMTITGGATFAIGLLMMVDGFFAAERGLAFAALAGAKIGAGISLGSFGTLLLVIAWTVAAARWQPNDS